MSRLEYEKMCDEIYVIKSEFKTKKTDKAQDKKAAKIAQDLRADDICDSVLTGTVQKMITKRRERKERGLDYDDSANEDYTVGVEGAQEDKNASACKCKKRRSSAATKVTEDLIAVVKDMGNHNELTDVIQSISCSEVAPNELRLALDEARMKIDAKHAETEAMQAANQAAGMADSATMMQAFMEDLKKFEK